VADIEEIENNWKQFESIIGRLDNPQIKTMLSDLGERLAIAPANARNTDKGSEDGGLIKNTLEILKLSRMLDAATGKQCDPKTLYKIVVLHNIGRIGTIDDALYLYQDSSWHLEKLGMLYKINPELIGYDKTDLTFQLLAYYGIRLSRVEHEAIVSLRTKEPLNHYAKIMLAAKILND